MEFPKLKCWYRNPCEKSSIGHFYLIHGVHNQLREGVHGPVHLHGHSIYRQTQWNKEEKRERRRRKKLSEKMKVRPNSGNNLSELKTEEEHWQTQKTRHNMTFVNLKLIKHRLHFFLIMQHFITSFCMPMVSVHPFLSELRVFSSPGLLLSSDFRSLFRSSKDLMSLPWLRRK